MVKNNGSEIQDYSTFWTNVKKAVVVESPDRKKCIEWANQILSTWKNAHKLDKENHGANRRMEIENEVIQDLFSCAVYTKKPYSQKFNWIIEAFLDEANLTKKMRAMFFRCTMPVVWRNLDVPNEEIRLAASTIILNFFPLISDDEFIKDEYISKQQDAMAAMLMDSCVTIRVQTLKKLPLHFSKHWKIFPRELIKSCLEMIVDKLSMDSVYEVRAAVYEGMEHLLPCADALNAIQRSLEIVAKKGINDRTEKVRIAAFKMLNKLHGHRYIKLLDLVSMEDLLLRLDFEQSRMVQNQIVKLILRPYIPQHLEGIDYLERFKRIHHMCKISSTASRHFHHLIYPLGLISIEIAVHHIRSILLGVKAFLRKITGSENSADDTSDTLNLNCSGKSSVSSEESRIVETDDKLKIIKHVLDSAIILWMAIRWDLYDQKNASLNSEVNRMMANILESLNQFPNDNMMMDSALVIARHLPKDKVGRLFGRIKTKLEIEDTKQPHFRHYVEALAAWDMNKLIEMIEKGLKKLRNDVIAVADPSQLTNTPRRRLATPRCTTESPPPKKGRIVDELDEYRRPLELIQILLSSPLTCDEIKTKHKVHLDGFYQSLSTIRNNFGKLLITPSWEKKFNPQILYAAYETFNIVALIAKKIEVPRNDGGAEISEAEQNLPINDRVLYSEMKWFAGVLKEATPSFHVVKMFLRCVNLHLMSGGLTAMLLNEMANVVIEIKEMIEDRYDAQSTEMALKKCTECLKEALEHCDDLEKGRRTIFQKVNPILEFLEDTQTEKPEEDNGQEEEDL